MQNNGSRLNVATINTRQNYPWASIIVSLTLVLYLLMQDLIVLPPEVNIPPYMQTEYFRMMVIATYLLVLLLDFQRFITKRKSIKKNTERLKQELDKMWDNKKKLQHKAHTYSDHAEKLKLFISDKLLEYIEYDEKFLHFKSIAFEVRHNGVISYDIVKTALQKALMVEKGYVSSAEAIDTYKSALDAMRYLWDLLDLSTADNIALHIANHLIECEEHYYQVLLNQEQGDEIYNPVPYQPDFSASQAVLKTINSLLDTPFKNNDVMEEVCDDLKYEDSQFRLSLSSTHALLGNENHIRLMLENIIKNAQHFSNKVSYKQKTDRISLQLTDIEGGVEYAVYNRGPHINDTDRPKLFQLGYSTRREKEHHGRGLGLFFVNEIVKGYEGCIIIENIHNQADTYAIRISLKNGNVMTQVVDTHVDSDRPLVTESQHPEVEKKLKWTFNSPVTAIEISSASGTETYQLNNIKNNDDATLLDPAHPHMPNWNINIHPEGRGRKTWAVTFTPIDIRGVRFAVRLPTANARMEGSDDTFKSDFDDEVDRLNEHFVGP